MGGVVSVPQHVDNVLGHDDILFHKKERYPILLIMSSSEPFESEYTAMYSPQLQYCVALLISSAWLDDTSLTYTFLLHLLPLPTSPCLSHRLRSGLCSLSSGLQHLSLLSSPSFCLPYLHDYRLRTAIIEYERGIIRGGCRKQLYSLSLLAPRDRPRESHTCHKIQAKLHTSYSTS